MLTWFSCIFLEVVPVQAAFPCGLALERTQHRMKGKKRRAGRNANMGKNIVFLGLERPPQKTHNSKHRKNGSVAQNITTYNKKHGEKHNLLPWTPSKTTTKQICALS